MIFSGGSGEKKDLIFKRVSKECYQSNIGSWNSLQSLHGRHVCLAVWTVKRLTQSLGDYWTTDTSWMDGWDMDNIDVDELMSRSSSIMQMTPCVEREREGGVCVCVCVCVCAPSSLFRIRKSAGNRIVFVPTSLLKTKSIGGRAQRQEGKNTNTPTRKGCGNFFFLFCFFFLFFFFFERAVFISDDMVEGSTNIELSR